MKTKLKCIAIVWVYFIVLFVSSGKNDVTPADSFNVDINFKSPEISISDDSECILMYEGSRVKLNLVSDTLTDSAVCNDDFYAEVINGIIYAKNVGVTTLSDGNSNVKLCIFKKNPGVRKRYKIIVYKGTQTVVVYTSDCEGNYTVPVRCMPCSTGSEGENETVCGDYSVINHYRWRLLYGPCYGQYSTSFSGDYLFHSMPYKEQSPNTEYDFELLGKKSSHGCVRLSVADAKWIYENCDKGSAVTVTDDSFEKAEIRAKLNKNEKYSGWDPTDTDMENPYFTDGLINTPITSSYADKIKILFGEKIKMDIKTTAEKLTFTSDNSKVAIVDENGVVTATGKGCCTVYVMGNDGSCFNAEIVVS